MAAIYIFVLEPREAARPAQVPGNFRLGIGAVHQGLQVPGNCTDGGFVPARNIVGGTHMYVFVIYSQDAERRHSWCYRPSRLPIRR